MVERPTQAADPLVGSAAALARFADRHPRVAFVAAQLAVWGLFYLVQYLLLLPQLTRAERLPFLVLELTMFVAGPTVTFFMHLWFRRLPTLRLPGGVATRLVSIGVAIWLGSRLWIAIDQWILTAIVRFTSVRFDWGRVSDVMGGSYWLTLLAWTGSYFAIRFWKELQGRERMMLEYQLLARDAQLRALAYQLNPHFLFNALNSVRALVLEDRDRAREMITRLSTFLRYTLSVPANARSTVAEEVEAIQAYLAIEQARFDERLAVTWNVAPSARGCRVPSLILQPLVENAIRHGRAGPDGRLQIGIEVTLEGRELRIAVSNTGRLAPVPAAARGVGLDNVRARLEHAFPDRHSMVVSEFTGGVLVEIRVGVRGT